MKSLKISSGFKVHEVIIIINANHIQHQHLTNSKDEWIALSNMSSVIRPKHKSG
jgi:hypothetical protein